MELTKEQKIKFISQYVPEGESPKVYWELLKGQIMGTDKAGKARPDEDLYYFMYVAKRTGLDPMVKQIYPVYRWDTRIGKEKMTIQVGIDGMRLVAERTGQYAGSDDAIFDAEDQTHPNKATIVVYKVNKITGERMPITASARWTEYAQTDRDGKIMGLWGKMPYLMLSKCAEALALRKAFPNELSGIYTDEEMAQAESTRNILNELPKPKVKVTVEPTPDTNKAPKGLNPMADVDPIAEEGTKNPPEAISTRGAKINGQEVQPEKITDNIDLGAMREANKDK